MITQLLKGANIILGRKPTYLQNVLLRLAAARIARLKGIPEEIKVELMKGAKYAIMVTPDDKIEDELEIIGEVVDEWRRYREAKKDKRLEFVFQDMIQMAELK